MKIGKTDLKIVQGDIMALDVEAIVNPANSRVAIEKGSARVIDAVTVGVDGTTDEHILRRACAAAFEEAGKLKLKSLAFPALGCGDAGFPVIGAAKIMAQEALKFLRFREHELKEVVFCLSDDEQFQTFERTVTGYVTHIQDDLGSGPYVTVDAIIELKEGIILIERSNPPYGWALPGGFVDVGESLETAVRREAEEETGMTLEELRQFRIYSEPDRDPRFHTVSTVFIGRGQGTPRFGSDAKGLQVVPYGELLEREYAFDHKKVIGDYLKSRR